MATRAPDGSVAPPPAPPLSPAQAARVARVRALARALDSAVGVPGTRLRVGLDAVVGLIPGVGDVFGAAASGYIVLAAARLGAPAPVLLRMLINSALDAAAGTVPLAGDLFDVGWRANARNVALLERHLADPGGARAASRRVVLLVLAGVALLIVAALVLAFFALRAVLRAVT